MSTSGPVTVEQFGAFRERVMALRTKFETMGRRSRSAAAYECRLGSSRLSQLLNCRYYDIGALDTLEAWIEPVWKAYQEDQNPVVEKLFVHINEC